MNASGPPTGSHVTHLGDFRIERILGEGGYSTVYAAWWGHRQVALKVLHREILGSPGERDRFLSEAVMLAEITHPGLVRVLGAGELPDGRPYLAMELLEGETLAKLIARGPLSLEEALLVFHQLVGALTALHEQGLVHRDLKPENVFLVSDGRFAVLLDLGIAKSVRGPDSTLTQQGGVRGTPAYMASERFFGAPANEQTDLYELAVLLYVMLTAQVPWSDPTDPFSRLTPIPLQKIGVELPGALELFAALSSHAEKRQASVQEFAQRLRRASSDEPAAQGCDTITLQRSPSGEGPSSSPADEIAPPEGRAPEGKTPGALPRVELTSAQADALALEGRHFEAAETFSRAADHTTGLKKVTYIRQAANNYLRSGRIEDGFRCIREVMGLLGVKLPASRRGARRWLLWERLRVRLRGLGYRDRTAQEVHAFDLERIDALYSASATLAMLDHIRGAAVHARHLRLALARGDTLRVNRALAMEANYTAGLARRSERAERICREVEAQRIDDPYLVGTLWMAQGSVAFLQGRFREASEAFGEAESVASEQLVEGKWERITARFYYTMSAINMGHYGEAAEAVERYLEEADQRNDLYARNLFASQPNCWRLLRDDRPEDALVSLDRALDGWPTTDVFVAHHFERIARVVVLVYQGKTSQARELLLDAVPIIKENMIGFVPLLMLEYHMYRGRVCLAEGDRVHARASIKFLRRYGLPLADGLATMLRATVAAQDHQPDEASRLLFDAIRCFERSYSPHLVAGCRFRLGQLLCGTKGERMREMAISWARSEGFTAPQRLLTTYSLGFPEDGSEPASAPGRTTDAPTRPAPQPPGPKLRSEALRLCRKSGGSYRPMNQLRRPVDGS